MNRPQKEAISEAELAEAVVEKGARKDLFAKSRFYRCQGGTMVDNDPAAKGVILEP